MAGNLARADGKLKSGDRTIVREKHTDVLPIAFVMRAAQIALGEKAPMKLAVITGASVSACEKWLDGKREPGSGHLITMMRSKEIGRAIMKAIVAGCEADWAREYRRQQEIADLRRLSRDTSKRLQALEMGDDE